MLARSYVWSLASITLPLKFPSLPQAAYLPCGWPPCCLKQHAYFSFLSILLLQKVSEICSLLVLGCFYFKLYRVCPPDFFKVMRKMKTTLVSLIQASTEHLQQSTTMLTFLGDDLFLLNQARLTQKRVCFIRIW